jgi:hypothetical protein
VNGHRRDHIANDIDQGHATLSPEVDALAAEVSRLSAFDERQAFSAELGRLVAASECWGVWVPETDRYLADFDSALVDYMKTHLTRRRDALRARARDRGWDVPAE